MELIFAFDFEIKRPAKLKTNSGTPSFVDIMPIKSYWTLLRQSSRLRHEQNRSTVYGWTKCESEALEGNERRKKDLSFHGLIDFGSCNLHTVNGTCNSGAEASGWKLKKILKSCLEIFSNSPVRRDDTLLSHDLKSSHYNFVQSGKGSLQCFL